MEMLDGKTLDLTRENINILKQLFPEVVTEGKIDFDKLKLILGEETESNNERYEFTWHGKSLSLKVAQTPSTGTLRPDKESSKNWDVTENLYIEGDNLEVLKLLQKSYFGKVKIIYIDPPYNTGHDFVYKDDFRDNIKKYKEITEQKTIANTESNGRYHTDWLNMMYPRLKLARNLLSEDGVIFISIDDNEQDNLKKICDEVFGENNFIAKIIHKNNSNKNQTRFIGVSTEYVLVYSKNIENLKEVLWRIPKKGSEDIVKYYNQHVAMGEPLDKILEDIKDMYKRPKYSHLSRWNKIDHRGVFKDENISREGGPKNFTIINPTTGKECAVPARGWGKSYEDLLKLQEQDLIYYGDDDTPPGIKYYLEVDTVSVPDNFWFFDNSVDVRWLKSTFKHYIFENPKPLDMIKQILLLHSNSNDIILDFFSGSATTAHAVMQLNTEDGGKRRYIMVQLPELLDEKSQAYKDGYRTICDIGEERIRRAGNQIVGETDNKDLDIGFKVFKLDTSNVKLWDPDVENLEDNLFELQDNIKEDRSIEDLLFEILLKIGIPLTTPIEEVNVNGKVIYNVGFGSVILCLENEIDLEIVNEIIKLKPEDFDSKVIFKETGFLNDSVKTNAIQTLKKNGITDVRSV